MSKKAGTKVVVLALMGVLEGQDKVFRGHKFVAGEKVMCCDDNALAAVLNGFRGRLPVAEPKFLEGSDALLVYKDYCKAANVPVDLAAVHNFGKQKGQVDINVLNEDDEQDDLDKELADLVESGKENDSDTDSDSDDDEDEGEDDDDSESEEEPEELNGVAVDPEVARENVLRATLGQLDHDNPEHWTSTGLPKIEVLEDLLDGDVSRKELNKFFPDFKRNH